MGCLLSTTTSKVGTSPRKLREVLENEEEDVHNGEISTKPLAKPSIDPRVSGKYIITGVLGQSFRSWVFEAEHKASKRQVAIKASNVLRLKGDNEIKVLRRIYHPNVIGLLEIFQSNDWIYFILEKATGGTLEQYLDAHEMLNESESVGVIKQALSGLEHLHDLGITHRNLTPQHLVLFRPHIESVIQIISFSDSHCGRPKECDMKSPVGTLEFCAPEMLSGKLYSSQVDVWAIGVILHQCLSGEIPFCGMNQLEILQSIGRFEPLLSNDKWDDFSIAVRNFIDRCLMLEPGRRLTPWVALQHPWITQRPVSASSTLRLSSGESRLSLASFNVAETRLDSVASYAKPAVPSPVQMKNGKQRRRAPSPPSPSSSTSSSTTTTNSSNAVHPSR